MSDTSPDTPVRLTQYSHGAGCGCKLSPAVLDRILANQTSPPNARLLVGNHSKDDAGAYDLQNGQAVLSTTDFFMPIVDDPFDFGQIASANAISDVYAMGGRPMMAIAILGWPIDKLPPEVASDVIRGARAVCERAGVALAGGHSIDSPEPIFGLAVNGLVNIEHLKRNDAANEGDVLFLTKPLGVGILSTAQKKGLVREQDATLARDSMIRLNRIGAELATIDGVGAMTDVTGFGLLGHLREMCEGSGLRASINMSDLQLLTDLDYYLERGAIPGGTRRNWESYGDVVGQLSERDRMIISDPQTSGGLLVSVAAHAVERVQQLLASDDILARHTTPIGVLGAQDDSGVLIDVVSES